TAGNTGDVDKAKALLKGKTVPKLQYCFPNTPTQQKYATVNKEALERAGFEITLNPIDRKTYYTTVGKKDTSCVIIRGGWGGDYPRGDSTIDVLMNGEKIVAEGNQNLSYFNEPAINAKLKTLAGETDAAKAAKGYGELDEEIMTKYAALIPVYYTKGYHMKGAKVGGTFLSPLYDQPNLTNIFVNS